MTRKKIEIKRESASILRPKKLKPFNLDAFLRASKKLKEAVEKEEKEYGETASLVA